VKDIFGKISLMQAAGIHALDVRAESEVSSTDTDRTCRATVLASNTLNYAVSYKIEKRDEKFFVYVQIIPGGGG
jgi:hypothetical protein